MRRLISSMAACIACTSASRTESSSWRMSLLRLLFRPTLLLLRLEERLSADAKLNALPMRRITDPIVLSSGWDFWPFFIFAYPFPPAAASAATIMSPTVAVNSGTAAVFRFVCRCAAGAPTAWSVSLIFAPPLLSSTHPPFWRLSIFHWPRTPISRSILARLTSSMRSLCPPCFMTRDPRRGW